MSKSAIKMIKETFVSEESIMALTKAYLVCMIIVGVICVIYFGRLGIIKLIKRRKNNGK